MPTAIFLMLGIVAGSIAHQLPVRVAKPDGPNGPVNGCFGQTVVIKGNFAFVGDPCENSTDQTGVGAVYRLFRYGSGWRVDLRIGTNNETYNGNFGTSLAIYNDLLAIGAPGEQTSGLVYEFAYPFGASPYLQSTYASSIASTGARFGTSVTAGSGLSGAFLAGAPYGLCSNNATNGFVLPLTAFNNYICAPTQGTQSSFGAAMTSRMGLVLIGAPGSNLANPGMVSAAYLYEMQGALFQPTLVSLFVPSDPNTGRGFGAAVSMGDATVALGAPMRQGSGQSGNGEVWVYEGAIPNWKLGAVLEEPSVNPARAFGTSVALSGDTTLWVGSPSSGGGAVYQYANSATGWTLDNTVNAYQMDSTGSLGASLAVDKSTWIAGAPNASGATASITTGAVYISADDYIFTDDFDQ